MRESHPNAMLALKTFVMKHRLTDFFDWRANLDSGVAA